MEGRPFFIPTATVSPAGGLRSPSVPQAPQELTKSPDVGDIIVSEDDIARRVLELGAQITADYEDKPLLLIGVLKGAFMFMADLTRAIDLRLEVDFMAVSSYGNSTKSSGIVRIVKDLDLELDGRDVLVVEDIIDSGLTLNYLRKNLLSRNPSSLEVCAMFVREGRQAPETDLKYIGFEIPPQFVVGYGLDAGERYRNVREIRSFEGTL